LLESLNNYAAYRLRILDAVVVVIDDLTPGGSMFTIHASTGSALPARAGTLRPVPLPVDTGPIAGYAAAAKS